MIWILDVIVEGHHIVHLKPVKYLAMKKFIYLIVALLVLNGEAFTQNSVLELSDKAEVYYKDIKDEIVRNARKATSFKSKEAYDEIVKSLVKLRSLNFRIQNAENINPEVDIISKELGQIAQTYRKVANLQSSIGKFRGERLMDLQETRNRTQRYIELLEVEKNRMTDEVAFSVERSENEMDEIEKKKLVIGIKAKRCIINSIEGQINIWKNFVRVQERLIQKLELNGKKMDLLLFTLKTNSRVFREAANVSRLRKSAKEAFSNLESLSEMESLLSELQNSWTDVENLVNEISSYDFNVVM